MDRGPGIRFLQSKPQPPTLLTRSIESRWARSATTPAAVCGRAGAVLGGQGLDQAHALEPVERAIERPGPQLQPREPLECPGSARNRVWSRSPGSSGSGPTRRQPGAAHLAPVSSRSRAAIAPPSTPAIYQPRTSDKQSSPPAPPSARKRAHPDGGSPAHPQVRAGGRRCQRSSSAPSGAGNGRTRACRPAVAALNHGCCAAGLTAWTIAECRPGSAWWVGVMLMR